ncbi:hypothetical protein [Microbacterium plantarum]|uniref:hypothetical protein n=1 Tax=Microbacterium plantarum TaxID=1816425 RepID=UPI002B489928|nr:hypothetical protein [Microbacterium plantarum]WRK16915.1 hypothetical protein VC184_13535 [Microbacterium plantarum]
MTVAIPFAPMPAEQNPNVKRSSSTDVYFCAAFVAFASFRRWNPETDLVLVTNSTPSPRWISEFANIGVSVRFEPFDHLPPTGFSDRFLGSLYLLDALRLDAEYLLLVDPDVLCVDTVAPLLMHHDAVSAISIPSPPTVAINGLRPRDAQRILGRLDVDQYAAINTPRHLGGELYGIPRSRIAEVRNRVEIAWSEALRAWAAGEPHFRTEEHVMTYALAGVPVHEASDHVRRIWTAHSHRTVYGDEDTLSIWHLPSEKDRGFKRLYKAAANPQSWFWQGERRTFVDTSARLLGVRRRHPLRLILDAVAHALRSLRSA